MSVLKGEGKVVILYGTISIPAGPRTYSGYLARPDLTGEWPTVLVIPSAWGITSSVKDVSRRLARQGLAALAPDLYRGAAPARSADQGEAAAAMRAVPDDRALGDLTGIADFIANPSGTWSSAEHGFGILTLGTGSRWGAMVAERSELVKALALVAPDLRLISTEGDGADVAGEPQFPLGIPVLGFSGRDDEGASPAAVAAVRQAAPQAEWVIYDGAGADYWDDYLPTYDAEIVADTGDRLTPFFERHLPAAP